MDEKDLCGIYCIENLYNNKRYIGQSCNINKRFREHKNKLKNNKDDCILLQKAYNKYGEKNFKYYILEYCEKDFLEKREIFYIKDLKSHKYENGYNISLGGKSFMRGLKHSEETKQKISKNQPRNYGKDHFLYGTHPTEETRNKLSISKIGNKINIGKHRTEEEKKYLSKISLGKKRKENSSSKYIGVYWDKFNKKWMVMIRHNKKSWNLGRFKNEIDAAKKYDEKSWELYHDIDILNFPQQFTATP
jgi:group I intron endonuclease